MKYLLVGGGAREHALAWKLKKSKLVDTLFVWPGNPASNLYSERLDLPTDANLDKVVEMAKDRQIDAVVVGPEAPLANGLANMLESAGIPCFGPVKEAAQLESSKEFAKEMMAEAEIPTAGFTVVRSRQECLEVAKNKFQSMGGVVLKASGLAGGKGVFVCHSEEDIEQGVARLYDKMAKAAASVVIEDLLVGRECSYFCFLGEGGATELGFAVDFKRLKENDIGPNTGGMGCYTPVTWLPENAGEIVQDKVVRPLVKTLKAKGIEYRGCLYVGLMWGETGPQVVEFNVRLGDPEAQILAVSNGRDWGKLIAKKLGLSVGIETEDSYIMHPAVGVVLASGSYPYGETNESSIELGSEVFADEENSVVFAAAVRESEDGRIQSSKGRVLTVVGKGNSLPEARDVAYKRVAKITANWPDAQWRNDIAKRVIDEGK